MDFPRITLFSTPLVSTWIFDETHRILFDCGDGAAALLDSKIHKLKVAAITHTHRDHCAGLMQLLNLRGEAGGFRTLYPAGSGAGRALTTFLTAFDSRSTGKVEFVPCEVGDEVNVEPARHKLRCFATVHYPDVEPVRTLSVGYTLLRTVDRLRAEYKSASQADLDQVRARLGREALIQGEEDLLVTVTGDTMPLPPATYRGTRVLLHECTFISLADKEELGHAGHHHTALPEALDVAEAAGAGILGLYHISRRYEDEQILTAVREACRDRRFTIPVCAALPGRLLTDFLANPVWEG